MIEDLVTIENEIRMQTAPCLDCFDDDGFFGFSVESRVTKTWRGWICKCDNCGEIIAEYDEEDV